MPADHLPDITDFGALEAATHVPEAAPTAQSHTEHELLADIAITLRQVLDEMRALRSDLTRAGLVS